MAETHFSGPVIDENLATDVTDLTDNSGGTPADTIAAIGGTYSQSEVANAIASLASKVNAILAHFKGT